MRSRILDVQLQPLRLHFIGDPPPRTKDEGQRRIPAAAFGAPCAGQEYIQSNPMKALRADATLSRYEIEQRF